MRPGARSRSVHLSVLVAILAGVLGGPLISARAGLAHGPDTPYPPPTPVPPNGSPSPYPTALQTEPPSDDPPSLAAASSVLVELDDGRVLYGTNARDRRPVASLTKIMTALLVLERTDLVEPVVASAEAASQSGAQLGLSAGETLPVEELLHALMLQSANDAAVALAEHVSGSVDAFVTEMNARARELGLEDTTFFSPNGLDDRGFSTAADLAVITRAALASPAIAQVVGTKFHDVPAPGATSRHVQNRNALLWLYRGAFGVKTGFTTAAGYCLAAAATRGDERLLAVVLGEPAQAWNDAAELLDFGFTAFDRREVIRAGAELDPVRVRGLEVPTAAGASLHAYVDRDDPRVRISFVRDEEVRFPLREGDRAGEAVVEVRGVEVGRVPAVIGDLPPTPGEGEPLWLRVIDVLVAVLVDAARDVVAETV